MTIDYWCYIYRVELEQLYDIFTKVLFKNKLDINKNIPYLGCHVKRGWKGWKIIRQ